MVAPGDWLRGISAAAPADTAAYLAAIKAKYGRGARAHLAGLTGASKDTAGRWLSGKQKPSARVAGRIEKIHRAGEQLRQGEKLRQIRSIQPRLVEVYSTSPTEPGPDGYRQLGGQDIDLSHIRDELADAWESGDEQRAAELLSEAIMYDYGLRESPDLAEDLKQLLYVHDFRADPGVTWE